MILVFVSHAFAACPATSEDLQLVLEGAEASFHALDLDAFRAATDVASADVACLTEVMPRPIIARLHRDQGLRAFVDGDAIKASAAFASARAIEPGYQFPEALVPAGHPVRERYAQQDPASGGASPVPPAADGQIEVDGRPGDPLPHTRPSVVQWVRADGSVAATRYVAAGEPLFDYPVGVAHVPDAVPTARVPHTSVPLAVTAGVALVAAGGCYAVAYSNWHDYFGPDLTLDQAGPTRQRTNTWFLSSVGVGAVGLGLGASAVAVGRW